MTPQAVFERVRLRVGWQSEPFLHVIEAGHVRRWAIAIDDPDPRWQHEVPPTFFACLRPDFWDNGVPEAISFGSQWLNGGDRYDYGRPARIGERIRVVARLVDALLKSGRSGGLLLLVHETRFEAEDGELLCTIRGTMIRR